MARMPWEMSVGMVQWRSSGDGASKSVFLNPVEAHKLRQRFSPRNVRQLGGLAAFYDQPHTRRLSLV